MKYEVPIRTERGGDWNLPKQAHRTLWSKKDSKKKIYKAIVCQAS